MSQQSHLDRRAARPNTYDDDSQATQTSEEELRDRTCIDVSPVPTTSLAPSATPEPSDDDFDARFPDTFEGIDWQRLQRFMAPVRTQKNKKSWIYRHGYRVCLKSCPTRIFFICAYCHQHKIIDSGGSGIFNVSRSTSTAAGHLRQPKRGHNLSDDGHKKVQVVRGQRTLSPTIRDGVRVSQEGNAIGKFDVQRFRLAVIEWLIDNNHPPSELETPAFKAMLRASNPEAVNVLPTLESIQNVIDGKKHDKYWFTKIDRL